MNFQNAEMNNWYDKYIDRSKVWFVFGLSFVFNTSILKSINNTRRIKQNHTIYSMYTLCIRVIHRLSTYLKVIHNSIFLNNIKHLSGKKIVKDYGVTTSYNVCYVNYNVDNFYYKPVNVDNYLENPLFALVGGYKLPQTEIECGIGAF